MDRSQLSHEGKKWNELVDLFLNIRPPLSEEKEKTMKDIVAKLSQNKSRVRTLTDQRTGVKLIQKCVSGIILPSNSQAGHICQLLTALLKHQGSLPMSVDLLEEVVDWLSRALSHYLSSKSEDSQLGLEILKALQAALRDASDHSDEVYLSLAGARGSLIHTLESAEISWYHKVLAMTCLHFLTYVSPEVIASARAESAEIFPVGVVSSIQRIAIHILHQPIPQDCPKNIYLGITASTLSVLYNIVICAPGDVLGNIIVSACQPFVFYGLPGIVHKDLLQNSTDAALKISIVTTGTESDSSTRNYTNRNRRKRLRRKRAQPSRSTPDSPGGLCRPATDLEDVNRHSSASAPPATALHNVVLKPEWSMQNSPYKGTQKDHRNSKPGIPDGSSGFSATSGSEDTDFSDLEVVGEKETVLLPRVRQCALQAINAVIDKVSGQHKFSFWALLVCGNPSLLTSVLKDSSPAVRSQALQVINTFLKDSHQVLSMAGDETETRGAFTGLGQQLGTSLRELHRCLALALLSEKFPGALVRTLKTIELLVQNVNYSRFKPGLLTKIVTHVKYFMRYKEAIVRANAFSVMVSVLMIKPQVPELSTILMRFQTPAPSTLSLPPHVAPPEPQEEELPGENLEDEGIDGHMEGLILGSEDESEDVTNKDGSVISWLIQRCMDSLLSPEFQAQHGIYIQVQLQSLKVLGALVSEHLHLIHQSLPLIQHVISVCIQATQDIRVDEAVAWRDEKHSIRGNREAVNLDETDTSLISPDPGVVVEHSYALLGQLLVSVKTEMEKPQPVLSTTQAQQLWLWTLQGPLNPLLNKFSASKENDDKNSSSYNHRTDQLKQIIAAANILSHLSEKIFESIGGEWQSCIISCVAELLLQREIELRLAGVRVTTIIVAFPGVVASPGGPNLLREAVDTSCWILSQKENNVNRDRLMMSWALANISATLEMYSESVGSGSSSAELLSEAATARLIEVGISACKDKDKIKPHGVRCLGNVTRYLNMSQVQSFNLSALVARSIDTLLTCATAGNNMKTRWNACHALGNIISSGKMPIEKMPWKTQVLTSLGSLVENFKNYKVRIQACSAVCGVPRREDYGGEYFTLWRMLLTGLDNAQNITDYQEIRHRDELINQISLGICQLTVLLKLSDCGPLRELLELHKDMAAPLMKKAQQEQTPEKAKHALKAQSHIEDLLLSDALTEAQEQALNILKDLTECT